MTIVFIKITNTWAVYVCTVHF